MFTGGVELSCKIFWGCKIFGFASSPGQWGEEAKRWSVDVFFYPGKIVQLAIKSFFEAGKCNVFHIVVFPCVKFLKSKSV